MPVVHLFLPPIWRLISASSARLPPSPLLSARMMIVTYFRRHDDHHRPEDQAEDAVDVQLVDAQRVVAGEGLAEGVDRRRADVAEDDADGADGQLGERALGVPMRRLQAGLPLPLPRWVLHSWKDNLPGPTANPHPWCPRTTARTAARRTSTGNYPPQTLPHWRRTRTICRSIGPREPHSAERTNNARRGAEGNQGP